jgi:hypothetical protein
MESLPRLGRAHGVAHVVDTATPGKARQPLCSPRQGALAHRRGSNQLTLPHWFYQPFYRDGIQSVDLYQIFDQM